MAWTVTCTLLYPPQSPNLRSSPLKTTQPLAPVTVSTPVPLPGTALKRATRPARSKLASVTAYLGIPETNASHLPGWSRDPNWEPLAAVRLPRPPSSSAGRRGAGKPRRGLWPRPPHPGPAILLVSAPGRPRHARPRRPHWRGCPPLPGPPSGARPRPSSTTCCREWETSGARGSTARPVHLQCPRGPQPPAAPGPVPRYPPPPPPRPPAVPRA